MKKTLYYLTLCILCLYLTSCTTRLYYGPEAGNWQVQTPPDTAGLAYTVYLLGDAGAPSSNPLEPNFKLLKSQLDRDPNSTLVVLGDNLYHDGLSEEGAAGRKTGERRLNEQVNLVANHRGKVFFLPGNHDWDFMGPKGLEKIRRQEKYIESKINKGNTFVPDNGCPGPYTVSLHDEVVFIAIDSHWWLHKHEKPYGSGSVCDVMTEDDMLLQLEQILEQNRGKHIVVSSHHPFVSNSTHGGHYTIMDHMFPLRLIRDGFYFPLPVIGSLYPFYRQYGGVDQDIPHFRYQQLINELTRLFIRYDNVVYAAGHDHNLQLHKTINFTHIISGSGSKVEHISGGNNSTFLHREKGFVKLLYYKNGEAWVEFWSPEGDGSKGKVNYRSQLYNSKQNEAEDICPPVQQQDTAVTAANGSTQGGRHSFGTFLLREHYRQEWMAPVKLPFLDMSSTGRALTPFSLSSDGDKYLLRLKTRSGSEYSFRPLLRNPINTVPNNYRGHFYNARLHQTWVPSQHPYAPLIVSELEQSAGLLTHLPRLFVMPGVDCLGKYQEQFKQKLGYLEPDADDYHAEDLANGEKVRVLSYYSLIQELERNNLHQPDRRSFAKLRLLDMLVGDWDRHEGQYSWAIRQQGDRRLYLPIAEDRDNAFFYFSGTIPGIINRSWGANELQHFGYEIKNLKGLNNAARNLDRRLLSTLTVEDWKSIADSLRMAMTDEVLAKAVQQMPLDAYAMQGEITLTKLKARREQLPIVAAQYAKLLAKYVDVYGSEKPERFEVTRLQDGATNVKMYALNSGSEPGAMLYNRTFSPDETVEIRLYGVGGKDLFHISGAGRSSIFVRVIGHRGRGNYQYNYTQKRENESYRIENTINDKLIFDNPAEEEADFASGKLIRSPASDKFFYSSMGPAFSILYNENDGLILGAGITYRGYKFRSSPYGSKHNLLFRRALYSGINRASYESEYKNVAYDLDLVTNAWAYIPKYNMWFKGYGNSIQDAEEEVAPRRVEFQYIHFSSVLQKPFGSFFALGAGPIYENYHFSPEDQGWVEQLLPEQQGKLYGQKHYLGVTAYFKTDVKNNEDNPTRGLVMNLQANILQGLHKDVGNYRRYQYELRYYMSPSLPFQLTFAGRLGGTINRGNYSFYQAAMLGGGVMPDLSQNIRGLYRNRLVGDRSLFTNIEMRASLFNYRIYLFPGKVGLLAMYDTGRVFTKISSAGGWHTTYGGGAWFSLFNRVVLSGTVARSAEGVYVNVQNGFFF